MKFVCVLSTAPNLSLARKLSKKLIENHLAACVNLIPKIESHYRWKGKTEKSSEVQLVIKTRAEHLKKIEAIFKKNHPYETPEFISVPILKGSKSYLDWLASSTALKS